MKILNGKLSEFCGFMDGVRDYAKKLGKEGCFLRVGMKIGVKRMSGDYA